MQKNTLVVLVLAALATGLYFMFRSSPQTTQTPPSEVIGNEEVKTFEVATEGFAFTPSEIKVTEGDTVRIVFTNTFGTHDFVLDEFDVRTEVTQTGETDTIEFVANQAGEFEYYCSVQNHRAMGMVGTLVVEAAQE